MTSLFCPLKLDHLNLTMSSKCAIIKIKLLYELMFFASVSVGWLREKYDGNKTLDMPWD